MPIGKNSIKRVQNAGYSKVTTSAPDMENSHVAEETVTPAEEKKTATKKSAQKTNQAKKAPAAKKTAPAKKVAYKNSAQSKAAPISDLSPKGRLEVVVERVAPEVNKSYVNLGDALPDYLL